MTRTGRLTTVLLVVGAVFVLLALPAVGQEEEAPTTTVAQSSGLKPAVEITDETVAPPTPDWTYRYLIPTSLVLAVVVILFTSIRYFTNVVRKRYRIVEE